MMRILITALEQCFLSSDLGGWSKAEAALDHLGKRNIPLILCSSRPRSEVESFRARTGNTHPFIVEDGAALLIPTRYFPFSSSFSTRSGQCELLKFGERRDVLSKRLREASRITGVEILAFHNGSGHPGATVSAPPDGEVRTWEYRECFRVVSGEPKALLETLERQHCRYTENAGVYHLTGNNDKSLAIMMLIRFFFQTSRNVIAVGVGRSPEDSDLLKAVDIPIIVRSEHTEELKKIVPRAKATESSGLAGWAEAVAHALSTERQRD